MDDFLDGSDELHIAILQLLEGVQPYAGLRYEVALVGCAMAMEHALSLRLLVKTACYTSAMALMRLQYEALTRSVWLLYAATDLQVETLSAPLSLESEATAKKMPIFSVMLDQVVAKAPLQASSLLVSFKDTSWHAMNSFVHSGIHPLRRHAEGYPSALIENVIRNSNGLNVMTLQLGIILSGEPRFGGAVKRINETYHAVLPELTARPN